MRRLLLILAGVASVLGLLAAPAAAATKSCVYRHSFNGAAGTLTITASQPLCVGQSRTVSLVSYTAAGAPGTAAGQFIYDVASGKITAADRSLTLRVAVPSCRTQVDAFFGTAVQTEFTSTATPYGAAMLGSAGSRSAGALAWYAGGTTACAAASTVTYVNACDGTFTATLANAAGANTSAVFLTGGRRIRLSPGRSTSIKVAKGNTLTVRDSTFTTHVATWGTPATACTAPTTPVVATVAPAAPLPLASTTPTASASPSASPSPTYAQAPVVYPTFPDSNAATALAKTGMGLGSLLAIALGLLLIGGGVAAITYLVRLNRGLA
ncbi:hypothetical protein [Paractinoplanes globisporus]|uniref:Uncharacterized protein n=1 Tax=Paractinoplanes globisporus TaxID=113565 RepID=A0ABW6WH41_9ACTN|nr:hypothetical protein [Actinoplanes globisporus]